MASNIVNDVINADNTPGIANLGGAVSTPLKIDTNPLFQLSYYTQAENKTFYDQQIADRNTKIEQISKLADIDLNNLYPTDKIKVSKQLDTVKQFATEYAKNPNISVPDTLAWQSVLQGLNDNYISGKKRAVSYYDQIDSINKSDEDASVKDTRIKSLKDKIESTGLETPIPIIGDYKPVMPDIAAPQTSKSSVVSAEPDNNYEVTFGYYNAAATNKLNSQAALGLASLQKPLDGTEGEQQKLESDISTNQLQQSKAKAASDSAANFNKALLDKNLDGSFKYFSADGKTFDEDAFKKDYPTSNTVIRSVLDANDAKNAYLKNKIAQVQSKTFKDKGIKYSIPSNVTEDQFTPGIAEYTTNGLSTTNLLDIGSWGKYNGDTVEKKTLTHTGDQTRLTSERESRASMERINANNLAKDKYVANLPYEKQKLGAIGVDGQPLDFGNLIYGVNSDPKEIIQLNKVDGSPALQNVKINNGVVVDKTGNVVDYTGDLKIPAKYLDNSIITEFNKYAGSTKTNPDGSVNQVAPSKLLLENGKYTVRMVNGEIQGIQTESGNLGENGNDTGGSFASANQFQHITLEAGQKSASKYKKPDVNYGKQANVPMPTQQPMSDEDYQNFLKKNGLK